MHWTYAQPDSQKLCQGDLIEKTPDLLRLLDEIHRYFVRPQYRAFMLLTQSCDLERRNGRCAAPYLTLAAVRSVDEALHRELLALAGDKKRLLCGGLYASDELQTRMTQRVESLINNNLSHYFFLRQDVDAGIGDDMCAFLRVTIPLKIDHYDVLLKAKYAQLDDVFQAKLGWLVGTNYARVGTRDWPSDEMKRLRDAYMAAWRWLPRQQVKEITRRLEREKREEIEEHVEALRTDPSTVPPTRDQLLLGAIDKAWPPTAKEPPKREEFLGRLLSDGGYRQAIRP